jgi:hypothetical protein
MSRRSNEATGTHLSILRDCNPAVTEQTTEAVNGNAVSYRDPAVCSGPNIDAVLQQAIFTDFYVAAIDDHRLPAHNGSRSYATSDMPEKERVEANTDQVR